MNQNSLVVRNLKTSVLATAAMATLALPGLVTDTRAQGCVASRGAGLSCSMATSHMTSTEHEAMSASKFQIGVGYRWLHSDRHYSGAEEQVQRQNEGSEVINDSHFTDLNLSYQFNPRYSATLTFPFAVHDRSQVVRSNDVPRTILERFHTQSAGLGDIRLSGNMWVWDPTQPRKGNLLLGVGIDAPTGEKDGTDTFRVFSAGQIVNQTRTVDQSIQLGDGGWGFTLDMYGYHQIMPRLNGFVNGSYTFTPEEKNGVPTFRNNPFESTMSIADSYQGRIGLEYNLLPKHGLTLSLAGRIEGVPVHDAFGGSEGFRRPGFAISIEPGVVWNVKSWSFSLYAPVAMHRNRERSVPDQQQAAATGNPQHGDAAFADFLIMFNVTKRF